MAVRVRDRRSEICIGLLISKTSTTTVGKERQTQVERSGEDLAGSVPDSQVWFRSVYASTSIQGVNLKVCNSGFIPWYLEWTNGWLRKEP